MKKRGYPVEDNPITADMLQTNLDFAGNLIPHIWYKKLLKTHTLKKDKEKKGYISVPIKKPKPYLAAITILSDVVYWYRPIVDTDPETGDPIVKKRFAGELLQRSYKQFDTMYGISEGQAKRAVVYLEKFGLIQRVWMDKQASTFLANVMHIALRVPILQVLNDPKNTEMLPEFPTPQTGEACKFDRLCVQICTGEACKFDRTYTKTSDTEITTVSGVCESCQQKTDELTPRKYKEWEWKSCETCRLTGQRPDYIPDPVEARKAATRKALESGMERQQAQGFDVSFLNTQTERDLMAQFCLSSGHRPVKSDHKHYQGTAIRWVALGITLADIRDAVDQLRNAPTKKKITIGGPHSITNTARDLVASRVSGEGEQVPDMTGVGQRE